MSGKTISQYYFALVLGAALTFSPTIFFSLFRKWFQSHLSPLFYRSLWALIFIGYPFLLYTLQLSINQWPFLEFFLDPQGSLHRYAVVNLGLVLLFSEVLIVGFAQLKRPNTFHFLNGRVRLGTLATLGVFILSLGLVASNNFFQDGASGLSGFSYWFTFAFATLQVMLVYGAYYIIYYLHHHLLFNQVLKKHGFIYYLFGALALLLVFTPLHTYLVSLLPMISRLKVHTIGFFPALFSDQHYFFSTTIFLLSLPLIIGLEWFRKVQAINTLEKEKAAAELGLLRQQINPHFFFNTLNNLYAMSLVKDAATPETIMQLSELMRYVIYKGREEQVALREEVQYLKDYIDLQHIRLHKQLDLQFTEDVEEQQLRIPPLLFIILLENAFKHGIEPAEEACFLHLHLQANEQQIQFTCRNSLPDDSLKEQAPVGIGLANLRRRLDILFPNQHQLQTEATADAYTASLLIQLSPATITNA